jgi:hypothetical protein
LMHLEKLITLSQMVKASEQEQTDKDTEKQAVIQENAQNMVPGVKEEKMQQAQQMMQQQQQANNAPQGVPAGM